MEDTEESAIADFCHILEEHQKNCEQQGKYVEAEIAKSRLEDLKIHEHSRKLETIKTRHIVEKLGVEEAHMLDFQQFNRMWDKKMADTVVHFDGLMEAMKERHGNERMEHRANLLAKQQQQTPKFSTQLLNYRVIEERLVKTKSYAEAHKMKANADALEDEELKKFVMRKEQELLVQEKLFENSKCQEMSAFTKRVHAGREDLKKQRHVSLERLLQRYQNVKSELDAYQNHELNNNSNNRERISTTNSSGTTSGANIVVPSSDRTPYHNRKKKSAARKRKQWTTTCPKKNETM